MQEEEIKMKWEFTNQNIYFNKVSTMASLEISGKKEGATKYLVKCFRNVIASDPEFRLLT